MAKSFIDDLKNSSTLVKVIVANVLIFLVANMMYHIGGARAFVGYLAISPELGEFGRRFWTAFTYMFFHLELGHLFWNMLWLYWMGKIFTEYMGSKRLIGVYILGGLSGALLFLGLSQVFYLGIGLLGASAGVMAIVVAAAVHRPNYIVHLLLIGPVRLKYIALTSFLLTSLIDFSANTGGKVAHIGGALFGVLFGMQYTKGRDLTAWLTRIGDVLAKRKRRSHLKVEYKRKVTDEDYNASRVVEQQVIDAILDKISKSGYDSLSKREKEILFRASNKGDKSF